MLFLLAELRFILLTATEGKRSKLETETSRSTRSSSRDQHERTTNRRHSSVQSELPVTGSQRSHVSPTLGPGRLPPGLAHSSKPTSPSIYPHSALNSPRSLDHFSPPSASPRAMAMHRDTFFHTSSSKPTRDPRSFMDPNIEYHAPTYSTETHPAAVASSYNHNAHFQPSLHHPSRRSMRETTRLPPLSHEDTTLSSESGHSGRSISLASLPVQALPLENPKNFRLLPQPIPNLGPSQSPLDRLGPPLGPASSLQFQPPDYRSQGSLAVLIRAGELAARVADDDPMEEVSP